MEAVGQLASGLAHAYDNLLTVVVGNVECKLDSGETPEAREILTAAEAASEITSWLLTSARRDPVASTVVLLLEDEVTRLEPLLQRALGTGVQLAVAPSAMPTPVQVAGAHVQQMPLNLLECA